MRRVVAVLLFAGVLTGCAGNQVETPWLVQRDLSPPKSCEPLTGDQELVLGVSQEMASAGRRHAALANLERLPDNLPAVRLSKARLLRLLGHEDEAEALYSGLLGSCLVADAYHGLGQVEVTRRNYPKAQEYLRTAASMSPANEAIRNDLGVVYMNLRQIPEARFELLTAMELNENSKRAPQNLLVLLIYQGNWQGAQDLVRAKGLSGDDFKKAEQRARELRGNALASQSQTQPVVKKQQPATVEAPAPAQVLVSAAAPEPAPVLAPITAPMPVSVAARVWALEEAVLSGGAANQARDVQQQAPAAGVRPIVCRPTGTSESRMAVVECLPE